MNSNDQSIDTANGVERQKPIAQWRHTVDGLVHALKDHRSAQLLTAVLAVQLLAAGGLYWNSRLDGTFVAPTDKLVELNIADIDRIILKDTDDELTITRADEGWQLDNEFDSPANREQVESLLTALSDLKPGLPVASSKSSRAQLDVAVDDFQRRILIQSGDDTVADLLLGSSPGFRKSHLRLNEQNEIFAARINTFDIPVDQDDWLHKTLLAFDNVQGLQTDTIKIDRLDAGWQITSPVDQSDTHQVDGEAMDELLASLQELTVTGFSEGRPDELNESVESNPDNGNDAIASALETPHGGGLTAKQIFRRRYRPTE